MLVQKRYEIILSELAKTGLVSVAELCDLLNVSEATVRRDINELSKQGLLNKVFGGAASLDEGYNTSTLPSSIREQADTAEKEEIAKKAASMIQENDFIYLDAGTTTAMMIDFINVRRASFVTNSLQAAAALALRGYQVSIIAGQVRPTTGAIIGSEAMGCLARYNFSLGFFSTSGISVQSGYTNSDLDEARCKTQAMAQCKRRYVLAEAKKFESASRATFAQLQDATLITNQTPPTDYYHHTRILLSGR